MRKEVVVEQDLLSTLARDRHQELRRIAAEVAEGRRARDRGRNGGARHLSLRLLARVLGPR